MRAWFSELRRFAGPRSEQLALASAWKRLQHGNGTVADFELIFTDLVKVAGYYRRPNYGEWMLKTKRPEGFELHSALSNARAEVVQHIMDFLALSDDDLIALERAAKAEQ